MVSAIDTRRLVREGAPVAAVLALWSVLAAIVPYQLATGVRLAGVTMVLLYVGVRGVSLAGVASTSRPTDVSDLLSENLRVALAAGVWFLPAALAVAIEPYWRAVGLPGAFTSPVSFLVFVFVGTGVAIVMLYAVAAGLSRVRAGPDALDGDGDEDAGTAG